MNQAGRTIKLFYGARRQKGYVILLSTFFALALTVSIVLTMSSLQFFRQKIANSSFGATQSYYAAEAGGEDALMRLRNKPDMSSGSYSFNIDSVIVNVAITDYIGSTRVIAVKADNKGTIKKLKIVYDLDKNGSSFYYGIQTGDGGLSMGNGSTINGNVFINGDITGSGTITNNAVVAGDDNEIKGTSNGNRMNIGGSALTESCINTNVGGDLTYVLGGTVNNCTVSGSTLGQSDLIPTKNLPIIQSQISSWKEEAAKGGIISGNYSISTNTTQELGPISITGNLVINNGATLLMKGTVYVVGNITMNNNASIKLSSFYGPLSGVILADGNVTINNNVVLQGSGQTGSYLMILSTSSSGTAIDVKNGIDGQVLYASNGGITLNSNSNSAKVHQITAAKTITLSNNLNLTYEVGMVHNFFNSGPGGSMKVTSWQEE